MFLCQLAKRPSPTANVAAEYLDAEAFIMVTYPDMQKLRHLETAIWVMSLICLVTFWNDTVREENEVVEVFCIAGDTCISLCPARQDHVGRNLSLPPVNSLASSEQLWGAADRTAKTNTPFPAMPPFFKGHLRKTNKKTKKQKQA